MTDLNSFRYQHFVAVSGNPSVKVPVVDNVLSSHEQEIYRTTSPDENSLEFYFQTDRNVFGICNKHILLVVEVGADVTGGGGGPTCIKIGYSSRELRRVLRPCIKIGYSSAMY